MDPYRSIINKHTPLYTTRLVKEADLNFSDRTSVCTPSEVHQFLAKYYEGRDREEFLVLFLDTANTVIGTSSISVGGLSSTIVDPRQIFKTAILANAAAIIVAHNHPSGNPIISREDVRITEKLIDAGDIMNIPLMDHIIICDDSCVSMKEEGAWPKP